MVIFLICFYLSLCFIYLIFKPKKKRLCFLAQRGKSKRVYKNFNKQILLFCSRSSLQFEIVQKCINCNIIFKKKVDYEKIILPLKNCGIDISKCIFKIEAYKDFNTKAILSKLNTFKKLQNKGLGFNLFLFVDSYKNLKKFESIVNLLNFEKSCCVRVYHCLEIDYKILCAINFLNLFEVENSKLFACKMGNLKQLNLTKQNLNIIKRSENNISILENENAYVFDNFEYKDFHFESNISNKNIEFKLVKTYDFKNNCSVFKLSVLNNLMTFYSFVLNIGTIFNKKTPKNKIYICDNKKGYIFIEDKNDNTNLNILGKDFKIVKTKNDDICVVNFCLLKPREVKDFYFSISEKKIEASCFRTFEEVLIDYKKLNFVKIDTKNKSIDYLINSYLPQKIIKNFILNPLKNHFDFFSLLNNRFQPNLINKKNIDGNTSKFYLLNSNLFCIYQNLIYFYGGAFCSKGGVNLNLDKSLLYDNCSLNFTEGDLKKTVTFKKSNLSGEVKINNVIYSNLKYLNFDNFKENVEIFY